MRRSICTWDPHIAIAGQKRNFRFSYTTASDLPKGAKLTFNLQSEGRTIDWQIPQTNLKSKSNLIWLELPNKKTIAAKEVKDPKALTHSFEFVLPANIKAGEILTINLGSLILHEKNGNQCKLYTQRKKLFNLLIEFKSKKEMEVFHLDVRGNKLKNLKIITPSFVARNKRFDVIVRFEDKYGNLTSNTEDNTLIELSHEHLRDNLNWKLFIPETGFITLPNLYFNEPGIYNIKLKNLKNSETFLSAPVKCFTDYPYSLYWGLFHSESTKYDATVNIENALRYFRDDKAMQFFATSPFDAESETSSDVWKRLAANVSEFNEDERFSVFLGLQWLGSTKDEGLRQFIFTKDNKQIIRKKDLKNNSLKKIYKTYSTKDFISIPSFTMGSESVYNFKDFDQEFEKVVEIYNAWGSSEMTTKEGNLRPISGPVKENKEGSIQKALLKGCRFGFVAGGLDDRGLYSKFFDTPQKQYSPGLTAIIAKIQTRDSLIEALQKRSCYATTGAKIIVGLSVAETKMGSELSTLKKPGLLFTRYITGYVNGTDKIKEIVILRNNKIFQKFHPDSCSYTFEIDDTTPLLDITLKPNKEKPPFVFYYLRAIQEDGHIAWSSPIWVDYVEKTEANTPPKIVKKK